MKIFLIKIENFLGGLLFINNLKKIKKEENILFFKKNKKNVYKKNSNFLRI